MVKFLLNMKALILVALLGMTAQSASAYDNYKEFFFKVTATAQPTGAGKVYVNNITVEYDSLYAETGEDTGVAEKGYDNGDPEPEQAYGERELWAKPNPGCVFVGWSTAENPDSILSTDLHYTVEFPVTSTDTLNRTTYNYVAHFEIVTPKFSPMEADGETKYYLYNVETHTFMKGGNDWGTRASAFIDDALAVTISAAGETYKIGNLDCDSPGANTWVDGNGRLGDGKWVITELEGNTFELTNTAAPANTKWGVILDCSDTRMYFKNSPIYGYTWALVSEADYNDYKAKFDKERIAEIHAAMAEEVAKAKQPEIDAANMIALAARENIANSTNVYGEGYEAWVAKTAELMALVEAGNYTEKIVNPNAATGWHTSTDYNFLLTPWTIGGEQANNFDKALYINTWSVEGISDGSDFLVPFFEYWTGDGESLKANTLATVKTGLTPGEAYMTSVWARVRIKNGSADAAHGITLTAGGAPVDVCAGEQIGNSQFRIIKAVASGVADAEGNLNIAFNIDADNNISWLSYKDVYVTTPDITLSDLTLAVAEDEVIDKDGDFKVVFNYNAEIVNETVKSQVDNFEGMAFLMANFVVTDDADSVVCTIPEDLELDNTSRNVFVKGLEEGKTYTIKATGITSGFMDFVTFNETSLLVNAPELPSLTFTVQSAPELAVSLIANDSVEYALNSHSIVTIDQAITAIKVVGLDQVQDSVTYAIYGMDKATLAEGLLSVNTIGYAEFAPVTLYEGNQYNVVIAIKDSVLFDQIVIGAAEPAEIEIAATLNNGKTALNTHSSVSAEVVNNFEVSFDGVVPMQAGYSISTMKQESDSTGTVWAADSTLAQGALALSGKGYAELEQPVFLLAGTKYLLVVSYQTFDGQNGYAEFQIDGACEDPSAINAIATSSNTNGKFLENGKIVIVKNGKKYNVAGSIVK